MPRITKQFAENALKTESGLQGFCMVESIEELHARWCKYRNQFNANLNFSAWQDFQAHNGPIFAMWDNKYPKVSR